MRRDRHPIQPEVEFTNADGLRRTVLALEEQIAAGGGGAVLEVDGGSATNSGTPYVSVDGGTA